MKTKIRLQLSLMMFFQFFIWGAWYVTMGTYLGLTLKFDGIQIGMAYGSTAIAAMVSPFIVGMVADRFFATERVLAFLHILGGVILFFTSYLTEFSYFYPCLIAYTLCYMPTLALANSFSFHHMEDPGKEFPGVRVLGSVGWITAGLIVGFLNVEHLAYPLQLGAAVSLVMGFYCLSLPHTPPRKRDERVTLRDVLGLDAFALLKNRSLAMVLLSSMLISISLAFYYNFTNLFLNDIGLENAAGKMTIGQMSEILFMILMPFFFIRLGFKKMLAIGMGAWTVRYLLFAYGDTGSLVWMLYLGIFLHGICYDFFFVTGQIYVDKKAPAHLKSSLQGLVTFATYGLGMFIGASVSGVVVDQFSSLNINNNYEYDWKSIWAVPAISAVFVLVFFYIFFKDDLSPETDKVKIDSRVPIPKSELS